MTTYTTIADSRVDAESPIDELLMRALRDNPLAIAEGDTTAPAINLNVGGSGYLGAMDNSTAMTGDGLYDFSSINRTAALTLPTWSIVRCNGDCTISSTLTISNRSLLTAKTNAVDYGNDGTNAASGSGAGSVGAGGQNSVATAGGLAMPVGSMKNYWALRRGLLGGNAYTAFGGGSLILIVRGNCTVTSGTITAYASAPAVNVPGGGGGSIIVIFAGTITAGTYDARGERGDNNAGGGGGGLIMRIASAFAGTRTDTVTGGAAGGGGSSTAGGAGSATEQTLTALQINAMMARF